MIYDKERLIEQYLRSLPPECEGNSLEALAKRIKTDIQGDPDNVTVLINPAFQKAGWYKHHHPLPNDQYERQARKCYCNPHSTEACDRRKLVPPAHDLPIITTDYDTNMEAAFWNHIANLPDRDDPKGDFIRDSRFLLEVGVNSPQDRLMDTENRVAIQIYTRLRTAWAGKMDLHPKDFSPLGDRPRVTGAAWNNR